MFVALKTLLAVLLLVAGTTALLSMLSLVGRAERRASPEALRTVHRTAGYAFAGILVILVALGAYALSLTGDRVSMRVVFHIVLAGAVVVVLLYKILFARSYRQLSKYSSALGLTLFALTFVIAAISAGFVAVTAGTPLAPRLPAPADTVAAAGASVAAGELLFEHHCASCHYADDDAYKVGPGLGGMWARGVLQSSGDPVTDESVRRVIVSPTGSMPSFATQLDPQELSDLLAYLATL